MHLRQRAERGYRHRIPDAAPSDTLSVAHYPPIVAIHASGLAIILLELELELELELANAVCPLYSTRSKQAARTTHLDKVDPSVCQVELIASHSNATSGQ